MSSKPMVKWTDESYNLLKTLWYDGVSAEEVAERLIPYLGRRITASTIRIFAKKNNCVRSPAAKLRESQSKANRIYARHNKSVPKTFAMTSAPVANPDTKPESKVPYLHLATSGPDPRTALYLEQILQRRKGKL
jgi:hypothetical protein